MPRSGGRLPFSNARCALVSGSRIAIGGSSFCFIAGFVDPEDNDRHQAGDVGALASGRLSTLMAVEVEKPGRPAAGLSRVAGLDPAHGDTAAQPARRAATAAAVLGEFRRFRRMFR
jgi:hypothetical protein